MEALNLNQYDSSAVPTSASGLVLSAVDGSWMVQLGDGRVRAAHQAISCLVMPVVCDRVALFIDNEACWITAVLARADGQPLTLRFDADTELHCPTGQMSLRAGRGLHLNSREQIYISSPLIKLSAAVANHCYRAATWIGERLETTVKNIRSNSRIHERVTDQNQEAARISIRKIEQMDRTDAGQVDYRARESLSLRSTHILAKAKKLTKIDGDQIQLG